jgi:predicted MFS family arabinose efflux permease
MARSPSAHPLDPHFRRNVFGVSLVEFIWGLGMPPVFESTFLQLFLRQLGASSLLIGLIPTLAAAGTAVSGLVSYSLTGHLERKRTAVILVHVTTAVPMLVFGLILGLTGFRSTTLAIFLVLYALFSMAVGLILPAWQNYLMKIFSEKRAVPAMAVMMTAQSIAKVVGSLLLVRVVERYAFSAPGASLVFTLVGTVFLVGSFPFLFTVEEAGLGVQAPPETRARRPSLGQLFRNRSFLMFLGTDLEYFALSGVIAFYANYAAEFCGINPALASGLFMAFTYVGGVLANGLLGWADIFSMRTKYLVTKSLAIAGLVLMAFHSPAWVFYLVSLLFGASRGTRLMVFAPSVKRLSGEADATLYFAVAPIIALPFSTGLPLLNGAFLDSFASLGAASYRVVFLAMAGLSLIGVFFTTRMRRE